MSPRSKSNLIKICAAPGCTKEMDPQELAASYATEDQTFYFHPKCFNEMLDKDGKIISWQIMTAIREFKRKGFEPLIEWHPGMKEHISSFEPPEEKKAAYLECLVLCLAHYKRPLSRKQLAYETGVPYTTVCWRVWDHLPEQAKEKGKDPIFFIHAERGPRGVEMVGLIENA